nr:unnamed protein product [Callosobruchus analis]CAI5842549.1 unnamed protein product [Callosobruchus analis]CAI5860121.1 unnamed protein product [Callosobruchus analis]CAI5865232.1 unnamed protein product [Callosobruchus analis]
MIHSLADTTLKQYDGTFKLWWKFCQEKRVSPFSCTVPDTLSFFQYLLGNTDHLYGSFNSHRSALSLISSSDLGTNPLIKRYMRGVFHRRPPKPKYDFTWDPEKVLKFLDTPTSSITSLKQLSLKLVTLLALATGQRIQTLALVKCSNIFKNETGIKIFIQDRIKSSTPASCQPCLIIPFFPQRPNLCVASILDKYLDMTKNFRSSDCDSFWLTYQKPHVQHPNKP